MFGLLDVLFPPECAGCGQRGALVCAHCSPRLEPAPNASPPPFVDAWLALFAYDDVARELVARVKYRNARAVLPWFAAELAAAVTRSWPSSEVALVTWAPTTAAHRHQRGFDHAELLARQVARRPHRPAAALLRRTTHTVQTGRDF